VVHGTPPLGLNDPVPGKSGSLGNNNNTPTNDLVDRISPIQGRVHKTLKCASSQLHNLWSELAPLVFRYNTL
jgi:hypothetical protein